MRKGEIYKMIVNVGWLSQVFAPGHRIRVTIASTMADHFEPNPNTGEPATIELSKRMFVARNTIWHDANRAPRIIAPVVNSKWNCRPRGVQMPVPRTPSRPRG